VLNLIPELSLTQKQDVLVCKHKPVKPNELNTARGNGFVQYHWNGNKSQGQNGEWMGHCEVKGFYAER